MTPYYSEPIDMEGKTGLRVVADPHPPGRVEIRLTRMPQVAVTAH